MLVDDVTVRLTAGRGGKGAVAFQKVRLSQGPTGGDGGDGGSIYLEGVSDIGALGWYTSNRDIHAEDGKNGRGQFLDGRAGEDLILKVPAGTKIINEESRFVREITRLGERILVAGGGVGGRGNFKFRSGTNTSPKESEEGTAGDTGVFKLELRLIADVGLIGLPNAGKSSLLNELTAARSRVANYAFTTLEPHLGAYYELILADIPGLIEGASKGKGLGVKFLRHIERTRTLLHLISTESDDVVRDYEIVRNELKEYSEALAAKEEFVLLTKTDATLHVELRKQVTALEKIGLKPKAISILDTASLQNLKQLLNKLKPEKALGSAA